MNLRAASRAARPWPSPRLLLLGLLLLPAAVALASADPEEGDGNLQCLCVKTTAGVHLKHITSLEVIRPGVHCPTLQMIATLKRGEKICLDPNAPTSKKIIKKLTKS
ncbi:platelet factor 4-like isoform 1-T1 [Molossus nigricans]